MNCFYISYNLKECFFQIFPISRPNDKTWLSFQTYVLYTGRHKSAACRVNVYRMYTYCCAIQTLERMAALMLQRHLPKIPHFSLKQLLFGGLGGGVGLMGAIFAVSLYIVESITRPQKRTFIDAYKFSPYELDLPAEEVLFSSTDGKHEVSGWYIPSPGATTTVIVSPGYRSLKADVLGIAAFLWRAGHNVLAFEYHGHGMDVGTPITLGYSEIN